MIAKLVIHAPSEFSDKAAHRDNIAYLEFSSSPC